MAPHTTVPVDYTDTLVALSQGIERVRRVLLDVIKSELSRTKRTNLNAVQAFLLFNLGDEAVMATELTSRGYYHGSNVSYNLKQLVEAGYLQREPDEYDRRVVRVRLTDRGQQVRAMVAALFARHATQLLPHHISAAQLQAAAGTLGTLERYWDRRV